MARRRLITALAAGLTLIGLGVQAPVAQTAPVEIVFGTQSGEVALDNDRFGGNPFASAFITALEKDPGDAGGVLLEETMANSGQFQVPDVDALGSQALLRAQIDEDAVALVVVFADYGDAAGLISLPGAAFDAVRVAAALTEAGYKTRMVAASTQEQYRQELRRFAAVSAVSDRALIYTTAHGSEADGRVILLPPDSEGKSDKIAASIMLDEVATTLRAKTSNRLFYAGCRDNPLGLSFAAPH